MTLTLSVTKSPVMREHVYADHGIECTMANRRCAICDGGLLLCTVCGAAEGELLDVCPGIRLTPERHEWNYQQLGQRTRTSTRGGTIR